MILISVATQSNISFTAIKGVPGSPCISVHSRQVLISTGAIFMPLARSFWGLGKNTERGTKQRAGKTVTPLYRGSRKARTLTGWRLIPVSGQEIDQGRHGQRDCLTVTAHANAGIPARGMEYLLRPRELSSLKAFPSGSLIHRVGEKQDNCLKNLRRV